MVVNSAARSGDLARLGLSYEAVRQRKPDIIYASLNAFGHVGPWAERPGHEQFAQAKERGGQHGAVRSGEMRHRPLPTPPAAPSAVHENYRLSAHCAPS